MGIKKDSVAIIGLGRFGMAVAKTLASNGKSVLALDNDQRMIDQIAPYVEACACVDTMDLEALREIGLEDFPCVIVGIGEKAKEASILTTALVAGLGVPRIIARATDELHEKVLKAIGAHETVNPEAEIGHRIGQRLSYPNFLEEFQLGDEATLVEIDVPESWANKSLQELNLRRKHRINVVAIRKQGKVRANPSSDEVLNKGDTLIAIGSTKAVEGLKDNTSV